MSTTINKITPGFAKKDVESYRDEKMRISCDHTWEEQKY